MAGNGDAKCGHGVKLTEVCAACLAEDNDADRDGDE